MAGRCPLATTRVCGLTGQPAHRPAAKFILAAGILAALAALLPATAEAQTKPAITVSAEEDTVVADGTNEVVFVMTWSGTISDPIDYTYILSDSGGLSTGISRMDTIDFDNPSSGREELPVGTAALAPGSPSTEATFTLIAYPWSSYTVVNGVPVGGNMHASVTVTLTAPMAPGAPTGLTATAAPLSIELGWTAPASDGGAAIMGYRIERAMGDCSGTPTFTERVANTMSTDLSHTDMSLTAGDTWCYRVSAINSVGTGTASGTASATAAAAPPTVTEVQVIVGSSLTVLIDGLTDVLATTNITVIFSESVTVPDPWYSLACNGVTLTGTVVGGGATYQIDPDINLPAGKMCTFDITNEAMIADADMNPLGVDGSFAPRTFTVAGTADNTPPGFTADPVQLVVGGAGQSLGSVDARSNVVVNFSERVNLPGTWYNLMCNGDPVAAMVSDLPGFPRQIYTIDPDSDLPEGASCTFEIINNAMIRDDGLNSLPDANVPALITFQDYSVFGYQQ